MTHASISKLDFKFVFKDSIMEEMVHVAQALMMALPQASNPKPLRRTPAASTNPRWHHNSYPAPSQRVVPSGLPTSTELRPPHFHLHFASSSGRQTRVSDIPLSKLHRWTRTTLPLLLPPSPSSSHCRSGSARAWRGKAPRPLVEALPPGT
jgi:hypothetical protein